jgi:acyl-CoA synthetase (AMP-forming)/AMP-acid ligase II
MIPSTVCDWVFEHAHRTPDAPALDSPDHRLTYRVLARRIVAVARALLQLGVGPGDHVVVALPNVPAAAVVSLAVQCIGAVAVEVSRDWTTAQLATVAAQVRPRTVAFASRDGRKLAEAWGGVGIRSALVVHRGPASSPANGGFGPIGAVALTEAGELVVPISEDGPLPAAPNRRPDDVTLLLYTSGSTGAPRAVMQTVANITQNSRAIASVLGLTARDRAMLILPLSYCYGRSVLQTHLLVGGSVFLDPRFMYPGVVLETMGAEGCTGFAGVPLTFEILKRKGPIDRRALASLRYVTQAGGAMSLATTDWVRAVFEPAKLFVMYGQTEATARLTCLPPERARDKRGSVGLPIPGVELRVVDDHGVDVAGGATGHLVARGANVTPGYYEEPDETAKILHDGWLWTGDVAFRDAEGFVFLVGRAKDVLKIGGHRVSPSDIEAVLAEHPDVAEVAVAGVPDALVGEAPVALVALRPGAHVTERELRQHCGEKLPPLLVPRAVWFARDLPRGPSGKVLRGEVASVVAARLPVGGIGRST